MSESNLPVPPEHVDGADIPPTPGASPEPSTPGTAQGPAAPPVPPGETSEPVPTPAPLDVAASGPSVSEPATAPVPPAEPPAPRVAAQTESAPLEPVPPSTPSAPPVSPEPSRTSPAVPPATPPVAPPAPPVGAPSETPAQPIQPAPQGSSNGLAVGALVCGICAIVFSATVILGIVLGIVAIVLAGKASKQNGKTGLGTGGKVCGIIGLVFSGLITLLYAFVLFAGVAAVSSYLDYQNNYYSSSDSSSTYDGSGYGSSELDEDEQAAEQVVSSQLKRLADKDEEYVSYIAEEYDRSIAKSTGITLDELGVNAHDLALWMLDDFSYEVGYVSIYDDEAIVSYDINMRDLIEFHMLFSENIDELSASGAADDMTSSEAKAAVGEAFLSAQEDCTDMLDDYATFDLKRVDGQWVIDEDSWAQEMEYLFMLM